MKLQIQKNKLSEALKAVIPCTKSNLYQILHNVLVEADGAEVKLIATNVETSSVRSTIDCDVFEEGKVLINAGVLNSIVSKTDSDIIITSDKSNVTIKSGKCNITTPVGYIDEFPPTSSLFDNNSSEYLEIAEGCSLSTTLSKIAYCIAKSDDSRKEFTGAFFKLEDCLLQVVSTDGHRLAKSNVTVEIVGECKAFKQGVIVPRECVEMIIKSVEGQVRLSINKNKLIVTDGMNEFSFNLIGGSFPDFTKVVPADETFTDTIKVQSDVLLKSLNRIQDFTNKSKTMEFSHGKNNSILCLNTRKEDLEFNDEFEADSVQGEGLRVGLNCKYLIEAVKALNCNVTVIKALDEDSPLCVYSDELDETVQVLMPVQR